MDARTLTALRESIEKWERNTVAETPYNFRLGVEDCPLCRLLWYNSCSGCPVRTATGDTHCDGTPYDEAHAAHDAWFHRPQDPSLRLAAQDAAREEVAFLRSLLPKEETTP